MARGGASQRCTKIILIETPEDKANTAIYDSAHLQVLNSFSSPKEIKDLSPADIADLSEATVIFASPLASQEDAKTIETLLTTLPNNGENIAWIHARSAGVEHLLTHNFTSPNPKPNKILIEHRSVMTNARGCFSSTLGEYCMGAIFYFNKDIPRLLKNKAERNYERYCVGEIRGKRLGIVGYGDIGRSCARLANAYGMVLSGLKRDPTSLTEEDKKLLNGGVFGVDGLCDMVKQCDYLLIAAPLTDETRGLFGEAAFKAMQPGSVIINLGRGPVVDEKSMIAALKGGNLRGAALDVFDVEPLPKDNDLWTLGNVLLSPHNMDMTTTFTKEATDFFVENLVEKWVNGDDLVNKVNKEKGY